MMAHFSPNQVRELQLELGQRLDCDFKFDPITRALYSTDASIHQVDPVGVAFPRREEDLTAIVEAASAMDVPLLPRGAGTSLAGQAVGAALVIDCSRHLREIYRIDPEERLAEVAPGVSCATLNSRAQSHGLMFGPDPASGDRATFGGMIGNNASGAHSICYGMTADHLLVADVILANGARIRLGRPTEREALEKAAGDGCEGQLYRELLRIRQAYAPAVEAHWPQVWRRASGYSLNYLTGYSPIRPAGWYAPGEPYPAEPGLSLTGLLCGSEGTLALIQRATVRLVPKPACTVLVLLSFPDIESACDYAPCVLEMSPAAVELIPRTVLERAREVPGFARKLTFFGGNPGALLVVEFAGDNPKEVAASASRLSHLGKALTTSEAQADLWSVRKGGLGLLMLVPGDVKPIPFIEDVAVPVDRLGEYVRRVNRLLAEHGTHGEWYAHASAGCLHLRPLMNLKSSEDRAKMLEIADAIVELVTSMRGALSGEHGDGLSRTQFNGRLFGTDITHAFLELKQAFDPRNLLNPGKIVPSDSAPASLVSDLRPPVRQGFTTHFAYRREGDFAHAVEGCNGQAQCLKMRGLMCPSYQATREEVCSTRGRANVLRAALSGALAPESLTWPEVRDVLDLCLECKGCKAECPSAVDMARLKAEYLELFQAQHGVPIRSRIFGEIARVASLAQPLSSVVNALSSARPTRRLLERTLGISSSRTLPKFAHERFSRWFSRRQAKTAGPEVVLFLDTYTETICPDVGKSAIAVLEACGYCVRLARGQSCCGRPMISKGLLDRARQQADRNLDALAPLADRGFPIIGLEPSCILTLRDEYLEFFPTDTRARSVARAAVLIEEFLTLRDEDGQRPIDQISTTSRVDQILFHGHCYTKALVGTASMRELLQQAGGAVKEIESGCCGMAGSFGYEAEHAHLSMAIGELNLFPAVREGAANGATVCASGISCRTQILDGTGVRAIHPIELVAAALLGTAGERGAA